MAAESVVSPRAAVTAVTPERLLNFLNLEHSLRLWIEETLKIPLRGGTSLELRAPLVDCEGQLLSCPSPPALQLHFSASITANHVITVLLTLTATLLLFRHHGGAEKRNCALLSYERGTLLVFEGNLKPYANVEMHCILA